MWYALFRRSLVVRTNFIKKAAFLSLASAFSRDVNTRKMSVYGFLEMLKNFKIEGTSGSCLSQGSAESAFSGYTVLSQVS